MNKHNKESSYQAYIRAPFRLMKGRTDGATVHKAIFAILATGVSMSVLLFAAVKIWAATSERITPVEPMAVARQGHTATALSDGRILISGGYDANGQEVQVYEIFDPVTQTFATVTPEYVQNLTTLPSPEPVPPADGYSTGFDLINGYTLYFGLGGAGLYPGLDGTIAPLENSQALHRDGAAAAELPDKKILVAGGLDSSNQVLNSAALFNPAWVMTDMDDYPPGATV